MFRFRRRAGDRDGKDNPCVSVLIPVHNCVHLTRACLESLAQHADSRITTEIIVVDDASTDETLPYLQSLGERIRVVHNETRRCFGENLNCAARLARGRFLCPLNNDTIVTPKWLTHLVDALLRDPRIGVAGNRHLFPQDGTISHAGMVFDNAGQPQHLYLGLAPELPAAKVSREFQAVTGACWLVPRTLFLELGGFDPDFKNGFEDVDFCLRVRKHGRKVFYVADSLIYHYGQSSPGRKDHELVNAARFARKWQSEIVCDMDATIARDLADPEHKRKLFQLAVRVRDHSLVEPLWLRARHIPGMPSIATVARKALLSIG